jgi:dephospho-CoA kinase
MASHLRHGRRTIQQSLKAAPETVVVLEAAVLIEAGWQQLVDEIWVTTVDPDVAIERASARDGVDAAQCASAH